MKKNIFILFISFIVLAFSFSCNKAPDTNTNGNSGTIEETVIKDFANNVALAQYSNLTDAAVSLNGSIVALTSTSNEQNLQGAQASWKNIRHVWEQCEGFLFGPIEDNDYDPNTDTWPTDYTQLDSLLASSNNLSVSDVANLPQSLRGYHPLEYVIFGHGDGRTPAELTPRLMTYASSLAGDILYNNVQPLYQSWASTPTNFAQQVIAAGNGSTKFTKRQDLFLAIVGAMSDICNEVGAEKMYDPYINTDSTITESPYSGNTLSDFKDNIIGLQNVYMGLNGGAGIKDLVASKNKNLDNQIQSQITAAVNSFDNITETYEKAIYTQRVQVQSVMTQLNNLKELLDNDLANFIRQYVLD
ncbi:MAG TPA: imelysin family protein [Chitinophagaceae bacterium]